MPKKALWTGDKGYYGTVFQARIWQGHNEEEYKNVETLQELEVEYNGNRRLILRKLLTFWREQHEGDMQSDVPAFDRILQGRLDNFLDELTEMLDSGQLGASTSQKPKADVMTDLRDKARKMFQANANRDSREANE